MLTFQNRELEWLLKDTQTQIERAVTEGLVECKERLCAPFSGFKLVMSSGRSEALKGIVVRVGTALLDCELKLKIPSLPAPVTDISLTSVYPLAQVVDAVNYIDEAVESVRRSRYANADIVLAMLTRLLALVRSAANCLKEPIPTLKFPLRAPPEPSLFSPPLPAGLIVDFYLEDSSVVTDVRVVSDVNPEELETHSGFLSSIGIKSKKVHAVDVIEYNGRQVIEQERVRVESQDPNLISATAKLKALENHVVGLKRRIELLNSL